MNNKNNKNNICKYCSSSYFHKENLELHYTYCKKNKNNKIGIFNLCNLRNFY